MEPTDLRAVPAAPPDDHDLTVTPLEQKLDRVQLGLDNMHDALGALTDRLAPVVAGDVHVPGDDQPEAPADGTSPLSLRLHVLQVNAHYLADKMHALAKAVEL